MRRFVRLLFAIFPIGLVVADSYTINTVAGSGWDGDGGTATAAILQQAEGIKIDLSGNLYIADAGDHRVRKITPSGVITTLAGTGVAGFSGDGGPAVAAQLNSPYGLALDGAGNLYIADLGNRRVRCVTLDGNINTVAGGGVLPPGGMNEGSPATAIALDGPRNVAWDGHGSIYIADFTGHRVSRLAPDGSLTTVAGNGSAGFSGDGGPAAQAMLAYPAGLAVDRTGALYIGDTQNRVVRKIASGLINTFAHATTPTGLAIDNFGTLYVADSGAGQIIVMPANSPAVVYNFPAQDVATAFDSSLYALSRTMAWRVSVYGISTPVAGGGNLAHGDGGPATAARLNHPSGVAVDAQGNLFIADRDNHRIRKVDTTGVITTVAGTGKAGNGGDNGPATAAQLNSPESVTVDAAGNLYIADAGNHRVRIVNASGVISALSVKNLSAPVYAIADAHQNVFIADAGSGSVVEVTAGVVTTVATGLTSPRGIAVDGNGTVYIAAGAHVLRIAADGTISAVAEGTFSAASGVALGPAGDLFVVDTGLQSVMHVDTAGNVVQVAGNGTAGFSGDGAAASSAELNFPWDVAVDANGAVYVADFENNRIRQMTAVSIGTQALLVSAVNAASLLPGPVAPGMLLDVLGTGLTAASAPQVTFNGIQAAILSVSTAAILVQAPVQLAGSNAQVMITSNGKAIAQFSMDLAPAAPALFADSSGEALALNQDGTVNTSVNPAPRGSIVALYGTGQGSGGYPVTATVGGYQATVLYAGGVSNYPGLFQINIQIPAGYLPPGTYPVVVTVGDASTQAGVTLSVE
jgi:uncharacterized protein (TIGR03437 family)